MSDHGYFQAYLYKIKKASSPQCRYCHSERDDVEHTFFVSNRWAELRMTVENDVGKISPENLVGKMLTNEKSWKSIAEYTEAVLRQKKLEESVGVAGTGQ